MTTDPSAERPIAPDAWPSLEKFREAGAQSFHNFEVDVVRPRYVAGCEANALTEQRIPKHTDYAIGEFQVRVYEPRPSFQESSPTPVIMFIHGGGWLMGNLETHHSAARRLAVLTGFPTIAVDYRLAPEHVYPAALDDCRAALKWISTAGEEHGINVSSISIIGDSAGGQLAAILTNEFADDPAVAPLSSQVLIYPITDVTEERTAEGASYRRVAHGFPLVADTMRWFIDTYVPEGVDKAQPTLSPLFAELPDNVPPTYVLTVDNDPLADEGADYAVKLAKSGVDVTYRHLAGYHHGIVTAAGAIEQGQKTIAELAEFIATRARL